MSEFFLFRSQSGPLIREDNVPREEKSGSERWSESSLNDLEEFKKRYEAEKKRSMSSASVGQGAGSSGLTMLGGSPATSAFSPSFTEKNKDRYSSMVEDLVRGSPSTSHGEAMFLPFRNNPSDLTNIPQRSQRALSSSSIGSFLSSGVHSPGTEQQLSQPQLAQMTHDSSFSNSSISSMDSLGQSPQKGIGMVMPQNLPTTPRTPQMPQLHQMTSPLSHPSQYQGYQTGYPQAHLNHMQRMDSYYYSPSYMSHPQSDAYPYMMPYGVMPQQQDQTMMQQHLHSPQVPMQSTSGTLADFAKLSLQDASQVGQSTPVDQANEEEPKKSKKPMISLDNQLVYLYPRHAKMEVTYTSLNNVHVRYGSFMSTPDVYFIARNHLKDLVVVNPYVDDYYYMLYIAKQTKSVSTELAKWIKKNLEDRHNPPEKEQAPQFETRLFGRISGISPKAPRVVVDNVEQLPLPQESSLNNNIVQLKCVIEECFDHLLVVDDYVICRGEYPVGCEVERDADSRSKSVVKSIKDNLLDIVGLEKGIKLMEKAFRILVEEHAFALMEVTFLKWDQINRKATSLKENSTLLKSILKAISKITQLTFITKLLTALVHSNSALIVRILNPLFVQILGALLKRGSDIRQSAGKEDVDAWNKTFTNLLFQNMKSIGFSSIVEKHSDDVSWMFLASMLIHSQKQQKEELLEQVKTYTDKPGSRANPLIKAFLTVASEH